MLRYLRLIAAAAAIGHLPMEAAAAWTDTEIPAADGNGSAIGIASNGDIHIVSVNRALQGIEHHRRVNGSWVSAIIASVGDARGFTGMAIDQQNRIHVAFYDTDGLKYARFANGAWATEAVDASGYTSNSTPKASIAVDSVGRPRIAYYSANADGLKFASWNGSTWDLQLIDSGGKSGFNNAIQLTTTGLPRVAYSGIANPRVRYARWNGSSWSTENVGGGDGVSGPRGLDLALDSSDNPHIAFIDAAVPSPKLAVWNGAAWTISTVDNDGPAYHGAAIAIDDLGRVHMTWSQGSQTGFLHVRKVGTSWIETGLGDLVDFPPDLAISPARDIHIPHDHGGGSFWLATWIADQTPPETSPPPTGAQFASTTTLSFTWPGANDTQSGIAGYRLQVGTDPATQDASLFDFEFGLDRVINRVASVPGGANGQTYYARVRAINNEGIAGQYSTYSAGTTVDLSTPTAPTTAASPTHPDGSVGYPIVKPRFTLSGPTDLSGISGYHWRITTSSLTIPNKNDSFGGSDIQTGTILNDGIWYFHAVAKDGAGNVGASAIHFKFQVRATVDSAVDNTLTTVEGLRLDIPAGALAAPTQLVVEAPAEIPATRGGDVRLSSVVKELRMADGTSTFARNVTLRVPYTAGDLNGLDESTLRLFYYDTALGAWVLISNSVVDTAANTVTCVVNHFTLFAVAGFAPAAAALERVTNYPNPFSPLRGQTTRFRYVLDAEREVTLRIYDPFGRLVADMTFPAGGNGGRTGPNEVVWDGRSGDGRHVEMGGYIGVVEAGGRRETVRVGVK